MACTFSHKGFGTMAACWPGYATPLCTISPRYKCDERTAGLKSWNRLVRQCRRCADCRGGRSATTGDGSIRSCWRITGSARADSFTPLACAMPHALRHEIRTAPTGEAMRALLDEQVTLIKSIPEEAARRVHEWALEGSQS